MVSSTLLLVRARADVVGLSLAHVVETMRPLARTPLPGAPAFVLGAAVVRGQVTPVVDLGAVLGGPRLDRPRRLVTLRVGERVVALAVDEVLGLRAMRRDDLAGLPPLLASTRDTVSTLGVLDHELLVVLEAGRMIDAVAGPPE